jgi:hypothetical protein
MASLHITKSIITPTLLTKLVAEHLFSTAERCCNVSETGGRTRKMRALEKDKLK